MTKCNPNVRFSLNTTNTVNGRVTTQFGICFPKGMLLTCGGISFTKDGIREMLSDYDICTALFARLIGMFDTITFLILLPFMILTYLVCILLGLLSWVSMGLFMFCATPSSKFSIYMKMVGFVALYSPITILSCIVLTILTPLQIIIPEFTCWVCQIDKWVVGY